eukprot:TRINITY_DN1508_c0_g2_i1.p1 TRINITY_DN1508_c0_g2~~TRINITY_DN1508_c0_g2_i1.p1  ORF type:complete len:324 (+),score=35.20 TRINITY_DN1508_c0_g2_i1:44-1015(+)
MGSLVSSENLNELNLPKPIQFSQLMDSEEVAGKMLVDFLHEYGFAAIEIDVEKEKNVTLISSLFESGKNFFDLSLESKSRLMEEKVVGIVTDNKGYVYSPGQKEYIKIRIEDLNKISKNQELELPNRFIEDFTQVSHIFSKISRSCFNILAKHTPPPRSNHIQSSTSSTSPTFIPSDISDSIINIASDMSSLSLIHYFKQPETQQTEVKDKTENSDNKEADKVSSETGYTIPSTPHRDTGLLTFGVVTGVPGLQIYPHPSSKHNLNYFVPVEELYPLNTILVWMGEKVPLFSCRDDYPATLHQVVLKNECERTSMVYLFDVGK